MREVIAHYERSFASILANSALVDAALPDTIFSLEDHRKYSTKGNECS